MSDQTPPTEVPKTIKRIPKKKHYPTQKQIDSLRLARKKRSENKVKKLLADENLRGLIEQYTKPQETKQQPPAVQFEPKEETKQQETPAPKKQPPPTRPSTPFPADDSESEEEEVKPRKQVREDDEISIDDISDSEPEPLEEETDAPEETEFPEETDAPDEDTPEEDPEEVYNRIMKPPVQQKQIKPQPVQQVSRPKRFYNDRELLNYVNEKAATNPKVSICLN